MGCLLITTALILFSATIVFNVMNIIWFSGCGFSIGITLVNIALIIATIIIQIIKTGTLIATLS